MPKSVSLWTTNSSISTKESASTSLLIRSRAVSLPRSCSLLMRSSPPPSFASSRSFSSSLNFSPIIRTPLTTRFWGSFHRCIQCSVFLFLLLSLERWMILQIVMGLLAIPCSDHSRATISPSEYPALWSFRISSFSSSDTGRHFMELSISWISNKRLGSSDYNVWFWGLPHSSRVRHAILRE